MTISSSAAAAVPRRRLPPLPNITDILRMYGIKAKKSLSQNFILDPQLLRSIARAAGKLENKLVVEVGPGPGGITRALLDEGAKEVHVIEKDPRFIPSLNLLKEAAGENRLKINIGDCLTYNVENQLRPSLRRPWDGDAPDIHLVGNLPFNVATPFIIRLLHQIAERRNFFSYGRVPMLLTFQHEVGYRMIAPASDKQRCRLSVICQNYTTVNYETILPGGSFVPPPDVDVALMSFHPLTKPYIDLPFHYFNKIITAVFHGKQKRLSTTAGHLFPKSDRVQHGKWVDELLGVSGLRPETMAVELTLDDWEKLCFAYKHIKENDHRLANLNFEGRAVTASTDVGRTDFDQEQKSRQTSHNNQYIFDFS